MKPQVIRSLRLPRSRRAWVPVVLALAFGALLLARGRTITIDCVNSFATPALAGEMPVMLDWLASHPTRGLNATAAPADSFLVASNYFDANHDGSITQVDTVRIFTGEVVLWKWVIGSHTVTSGTGTTDPNAGLLFDQPISSLARSFSYQFNTVGTYPFFCRPHGALFNMRGFVVVTENPAAVTPAPIVSGEGFVRAPWPNPARNSSTFRFALARAGHARVTVLDAQGRRVATVFDRDLGPGTFDAAWDTRTVSGAAAPAGLYLVRLEMAGRSETRRLTLVR
jgi:plastocyanin